MNEETVILLQALTWSYGQPPEAGISEGPESRAGSSSELSEGGDSQESHREHRLSFAEMHREDHKRRPR